MTYHTTAELKPVGSKMYSKQPTLAVIVPAYNVSRYIDEALDSIAAQQPAFDEIIIVNDGSTDDTLARIENHPCSKHAKIITTQNRGPGPARNTGIECASSDYIYFLDSDDILNPAFTGTILDCLEKDDYPDLVLFGSTQFRDGVDDKANVDSFSRNCIARHLTGEQAIAKLKNTKGLSPSPCIYISSRSLWADKRLEFQPILHEDEETILKLMLSAESVSILSNELFHRRVRPGSIMSSKKTREHCIGLAATANSLTHLLQTYEFEDEKLKKFIRHRAIRNASRYMRTCHKANTTVNYRHMLYLAKRLNSPDILLSIFGSYAKGMIRKITMKNNEKNNSNVDNHP